jgi:tripartite ATP-independent transporter DctP family solute receptor
MKTKKVLALAMAAAMAVGMSTTVSAAEYTIKLCTEQTDGDPIDEGCDKWAELVEEATEGAVKIEVYPSSQLGAKADLIEMALAGQGVCTIADGSYLMDYVPDFGVVMGPFLFSDWDSMYNITGSDWWTEQSKKLEDEGLEIISTNWIYGERQLMTKEPVTSLKDMKGLKIRVPNNDVSVQMFNLLGSAATPMALSEVYTSLSQGVVDGVENPLTTLYNNAFQEVCKNVTMTNHQMTFSNFIVGKDFWDTIPEEYQEAIISCGEEAAEYNNELYKMQSEEIREQLEAAGCTVVDLEEDVYEEFRDACLKVYEDYEANGTWTAGLYDSIQEIIGE